MLERMDWLTKVALRTFPSHEGGKEYSNAQESLAYNLDIDPED